jgi:hypothetical protein
VGAYVINVFALPVVILAGFVVWYRFDRRLEPAWRRWTVLAGLLCSSVNLALYARWQFHVQGTSDTATVGLMLQQSGSTALWLAGFGLACAIAGKGIGRGVLAVASIMGLFIWVVPAIL